MTVGSKEYMAHASKIKQLKGLIDDHKRQIGSVATAWQKAKDTILSVGLGVAGGNMLTAFLGGAKRLVGGIFSNAIQVSDTMADIRKTTGMTTEEVEALDNSLRKIDTRTSVDQLREIAIVAGQLGIAKNDVLGFVDAVDKTVVALGDEFTGGAEEVASVVGKLRNNFSDIKSDNVGEDIMHIGNALNELGAAGFATAPVVADFANRIGGAGIPLGLTSGQVLGLSATLQELNVSTERGSTAITRILGKMTTDTDKFAAVAGMSIKDFEKLVNTDLYGAFLKVIEGSKKSGKEATVLGGIIKDLGVDGEGAKEVFMKLGSNIAMLDEKVNLANNSLLSTDSIMNEFNLKNENLAGTWEKFKKQMTDVVTGLGQKLAPVLQSVMKGFMTFADWVKRNASAIGNFLKIVVWGTSVLIAYNIAAKVSLAVKKLLKKATDDDTAATIKNTLGQRIAAAATYLYTAAVALLSGNLKKAAVAMRAFSIVTKMNPIGLLVGVVTAVAGAIALFRSRAREASVATESWARVNKSAKEGIGDMVGKVNEYRFMLKRAHGNQDEFNKIVKEWNSEIGGKYKATLDAATASIEDIDKAANSAAKAIMGMAVVAAISKEIQELTETNADAVSAWINAEDSVAKASENLAQKQAELKKVMANPVDQKQINDALEAVNSAQKRLDQAKKGGYSAEARALVDQGKAVQLQIEALISYQDKLKEKLGMSDAEIKDDINKDGPVTDISGDSSTYDKDRKKKEAEEFVKIYTDIRGKIKAIYDQMGMDQLTAEQKELLEVQNKYDDLLGINQRAQAEIAALGNAATADELATAKALASQEKDLLLMKESEQAAIREKYAKLKAEKRAEVEEQLRVVLMSADQKEIYDVTKKYEELIKLAQEYGFDTVELYKKMQEELDNLKSKGTTDLFGMTTSDWDSLFSKFDMLGQAMSYASEWAQNTEEAYMQKLESDYEKQNVWLDEQLEKKRMNEDTYNILKKQYEDEYEAKKLEIQRKQVKREKDIKTFEAVISLAKNIVEAGVITPQAFLIAALGALQIAAIRSQPLPQMWAGGFTLKSSDNRQPAGTVHANEWVSPAWMVKDPVTGPLISQLEAIRASGNARRAVSVPQSQRNMAQQGSADIANGKMDALIYEFRQLNSYMKDPDNRRAYLVHDSLTRYQDDLINIQQLRKIS